MNSHPKQAVEQGFEQDRQDYWAMRAELLAKYSGKWVAVHKGRVVAVGDDPLSIMEQATAEDGYAYTNKVGDEDKIAIRQRRVSFPYDDTYVEPVTESERLIGREVLNQTKVTFDGPLRITTFD